MATSKDEILQEIHKFVAEHQKPPGEHAFAAATRIKESAWKGRIWVRWTDAVREAGYEPNQLNQRIPDEDMLQQLATFIVALGPSVFATKSPCRHEE
jgi:hypothetical protein